MSEAFPVTRSIFSATALSEVVVAEYALAAPIECLFFQLGLKDTHLVKTEATTYVLRIYRRGWRSLSEIQYELEVLLYLQKAKIAFPPRSGGTMGGGGVRCAALLPIFLTGIVASFGVSHSMAKKLSAGILLYRIRSNTTIQVLLVHPGGPFWAKKDDGTWSIPKGEYDEGADALEAAKREFHEETSFEIRGETVPLMPVRQPSGKVVSVWAVDGDIDATSIRSASFRMEWPPKSGKLQEFPEVDRAEWFDLSTAYRKILPGQRPFLAQLQQMVQKRID